MNWKIIMMCAGVLLPSAICAYDNNVTHPVMTSAAVQASDLNNSGSGILQSLGLRDTVDDPYPFVSYGNGFYGVSSVNQLMQYGAYAEDFGLSESPYPLDQRVFRHFFDPQQGEEGLNLPYLPTQTSSPLWALKQSSDGTFTDVNYQKYSYHDAKDYMYKALTSPTKDQRNSNLNLVFVTLGHVIHHLQDMAQPQHVRNEDHCSYWACIGPLHHPSAYEQFTQDRGGQILTGGYPVVDIGTFSTPFSFWKNSGKGIAEYTSTNFVGIRTNFVVNSLGSYEHAPNHGSPDPVNATINKRQITDPDLLGPQGPNQPLRGEIWFFGSPVTDSYNSNLTVDTGFNSYTSTFSLLNGDLTGIAQDSTANPPYFAFSLNSFNYAAANQFLTPRAVGYSAGLINYFFRGRIEISLPDEGFFSIVDHAVTNTAGTPPSLPQGFTKIKLKLRNVTPAPQTPDGRTLTPDSMPSGTVTAIVRYTLNSCYQKDLTGDYGNLLDGSGTSVPPANCSYLQYLTSDQFISQSVEISGASIPANATAFTFDFSAHPIPINARDLRIQVVYRGAMGAETDAIAVGGRAIAEPTYLVIFNNTDYFDLNGNFMTPAEVRQAANNDPSVRQQIQGLNVDAEPYNLTETVNHFTLGSINVQLYGYTRLAVLTDLPSTPGSTITLTDSGFTPSGFSGVVVKPNISPIVNQTEPIDIFAPQPVLSSLGVYRGVRGHSFIIIYKGNASAPDPGLNQFQTMSTRTVTDSGPTTVPLNF